MFPNGKVQNVNVMTNVMATSESYRDKIGNRIYHTQTLNHFYARFSDTSLDNIVQSILSFNETVTDMIRRSRCF